MGGLFRTHPQDLWLTLLNKRWERFSTRTLKEKGSRGFPLPKAESTGDAV